jgi:hypothetical protein
LGWAEGFEPSTTGTTIRRSTKLSYAHHVKEFLFYQGVAMRSKRQTLHIPERFHSSSTLFFTSSDIASTPGQGRVNPSPGHFFVASTPIFEP